MKTTKWTLVCIFTLSFAVLLFIVTLFTYEFQKVEQDNFTDEILENAETVTSQLATVLNASNQLTDFQCTNTSINKLRDLVQNNLAVFDVGYIVDDTVYCTANWGELEPTKLKAENSGSQNGYRFYANEKKLYNMTESYNITARGHFFAVNIATNHWFQFKKLPKYHFKIYSNISDYVFDTYTPEEESHDIFALTHETTICSKRYSYCVMTVNRNAGPTFYSERTQLVGLLVIFILCYLVTHLAKLILLSKNTIEARFRKALDNGSLFMEYQPIVNIKNGKIEAVESLVRWKDDVYGHVSPELFIHIAEKLSLYPDLAYFTARRSIKEMASILRDHSTLSLSINIGNYEILDDEFLPFLNQIVTKEEIVHSQIKIEITERVDVALPALTDFSNRARALGFLVVLDDFGTGVSNLVWLTEVNFDYIKIDRVFVNALNFDIKKGMVNAVMNLVTSLGKDVVFEGVETAYEYDMIKEHCASGYVQGWYFYRAVPLDRLKAILEEEMY
ncbi:EAL domain-containing protein [Vibrio fluvialis]|nr:EAL domain-containing protein [Vibrio fluvialis]MBY8267694.1 EAL domain-containing protein [Vibrio fluvialis]